MKRNPLRMATAVLIITVVVAAVLLLTDFRKSYDIEINVSESSTNIMSVGTLFYLSDAEISPDGNTVTFTVGQDVGDSMIVLKPVQCGQEYAYEPTYITPGLPVQIKAEPGAWFQIGIAESPKEGKTVTISVSGADIRIP